MKAFIIIQNFLTALVIPIFAAIIGITAIPALALFDYGYQISTSNTENYLLELMGIGVSLGLFVMAWGISLVIFSGFMAGLLRPRLAPKYPLQSFVTIQWAWSMIFHKAAFFFFLT